MTRPTTAAGLLAALALFTPSLHAADWPQWMGPNRDAVWAESGIVQKFPDAGPKVLWRTPIGGGYSGPAVVGGRVYVTDRQLEKGVSNPSDPFDVKQVSGSERVLCFDAKTGQEVWKHEYECKYTISYPAGPRCTPTVHEGKVYALGAMGHLVCLDAAEGPKKIYWQKHFPTDYGAKVPMWGFAGHPIIHKNLVVCLVGGGEGSTVVAFDKDTGKEAWKALSAAEPGYNSPILIQAGGVTQLVVWTPVAVNGLNPDTGAVYWSVPCSPMYGMSIMTPRKDGDLLFVAGIGGAAVVLELLHDKPDVREVWREDVPKDKKTPKTRGLYPVNMTPFVENGTAYGVDATGVMRAFELKTGKRLWATFKPVFGEEKEEDFGGGSSGTAFVVKNDDRFFLFAETGDLIIAKMSPAGYEELSRAKLLAPTNAAFGRKVVWSHPAFANKCVFARNDKEIVCASLAAE
jgi:outer membrane protein assembly factor BamB